MNATDAEQEFDALLDYLKRSRGFDFSGYKRTGLMRRVRKRMQTLGMEHFEAYQDYLQVDPEEFTFLFNTILINVTTFFRDTPSWEYVASTIVPRVIEGKDVDEPIRAWVAGCSSGQEAYTLAIILAEALGESEFNRRVKIYATDVDEEALNQARQASYTAKEVSDIPQPLLEKYFERTNMHYVFRKDLRRSVIFGRHDLVQDAPISKVDLLTCRNTLMYFNAETQSKILSHFAFALREDGFLFLGKSEMLLTHSGLFTPEDLKRRVFTKAKPVNPRERTLQFTHTAHEDMTFQTANHTRLREAAFDGGPSAQVVVDTGGVLILASQRARVLFNLTNRDLGRPVQDLELSYRPIELRSRIEQAIGERRLVSTNDVSWPQPDGTPRFFDVSVVPVFSQTGNVIGVTITFADVTLYRSLHEQLQHSKQELETAYEELQSTVEELETTNEELQSTNEELETTNEELQSTNEELETMNEELQSTNEELETINQELRDRTDELNRANNFLESIMISLRMGVIVLDKDLTVQIWNQRAEDQWGLRADEVRGQHFLNLDIGLPVDELRQPIRSCLASESDYQEVTVSATNRRGKSVECKIICTPLLGIGQSSRGVILLIEDYGA